MVSTDQLRYDRAELLSSEDVEAPLVACGVRCHGGFDGAGRYVSPRTGVRMPAIAAWQASHRAAFGTEILTTPLETWPEQYPNVAQVRHLLRNGVRAPFTATLTRIGTVEGFGAMIRYTAVPDIQRHFVEDVADTAIGHLDKGLLEAHARDEAGYGDEGGHTAMWFAARDIALENPVTADETALMLERMGIAEAFTSPPESLDAAALRKRAEALRMFADVPLALQFLVGTMARILLIEIQAFHTFVWAEELLGDTELVAGDGEAGRLVSYIRQDEAPHVEYLRTALTEMRDRTFKGESGKTYPGSDIVGAIWDSAMQESLGPRRDDMLRVIGAEVERAIAGHPRAADLRAEFHALGSAAK